MARLQLHHAQSPAQHREPVLRRVLVLLPVLCLLLSVIGPARVTAVPAPAAPRQPVAVLFLIPDVGFHQLRSHPMPSLERLARDGSAGMLNIRTVRDQSIDEGFLSIGAGSRANASFSGEIGQSVNSDERFEGASGADVYRRRTGFDPDSFAVLNLNYEAIQADSAQESYDLEPGLLGDSLREGGIRTAVVGNADALTPDGLSVLHREIVGVAMDHLGRVQGGDVSQDLTLRDPASPFSVRIDPGQVLRRLDQLMPGYRFIAIEDGDLVALQENASVFTPSAFKREESEALTHIDSLIGAVASRLDLRRDLLLVASPVIEGPEPADISPIFADGPGFTGGFLSSNATRRVGLSVITDIAPTVLHFFDLPTPPEMSGGLIHPAGVNRLWGAGPLWQFKQRQAPMAAVTALALDQERLGTQHDDVLRWFVYLCQILILIAAAACAWPMWEAGRRLSLDRWGFLVPLALPLALLIEPYFHPASSAAAALAVAALTAALVLLAMRVGGRGTGPVAALAWVNVAAVSADLLTGQQGMISSMLSYAPAEGARYYGIGNEYMGVLVGASVTALCLGAGSSSWRRALAAAALFIPALMICAPSIGAKAGGALVAVPTAALGFWLLVGGRPGWRVAVILAVLSILSLGGLALHDSHSSHHMTHIGKAARSVESGGVHTALDIVARKADMESRLIRYSPWSRTLLAAIAASLLMFFTRRRRWTAAVGDRRLAAALWSLGLAAITSLLFNDAGVLAAALAFVYFPALAAGAVSGYEYSTEDQFAPDGSAA